MADKKIRRSDVEFIERHASDMSVRELADELGLSKTTVQRIARKAEALTELTTTQNFSPAPPVAGSELALLQELAGVLRTRVRTAKDSAVPQLSREYRETLAKITALEGAQNDEVKEGGDAFDAACAGIS